MFLSKTQNSFPGWCYMIFGAANTERDLNEARHSYLPKAGFKTFFSFLKGHELQGWSSAARGGAVVPWRTEEVLPLFPTTPKTPEPPGLLKGWQRQARPLWAFILFYNVYSLFQVCKKPDPPRLHPITEEPEIGKRPSPPLSSLCPSLRLLV